MKTRLKYIIAILAAVALPLGLASAQNFQFNNNPANTTSGSPVTIVGAPGGTVTFSLQVVLPSGFATQSLDYWLIEASGPAGYPFSIINRDYTGSHFPCFCEINDPATMAPGNRLDPVNNVDLGSTVSDGSDRTNGAFQVANYTLSISPTAAPGVYRVQTFDYPGFGINDVTPTAQAAINIQIGGSGPEAQSIVSRKTHGSSGDFDIVLPQTSTPNIECRTPGSGYQLVFTFNNNLVSVGSAEVTSGTGSVSSSTVGPNQNQYRVNLTGVTDAQYIIVRLSGVLDSTGASGDVSAVMGVLVGDATNNRIVSNTDVAAVQNQVSASVTASNFRSDVNATGLISGTDKAATKSNVGATLGAPPPTP